MRYATLLLLAVALSFGACHSGPNTPVYLPLLPADFAATYKQVRPCRNSTDHDLNNVTVLADPNAYGPYTTRTDPFPVGAVVVKQEHLMEDQNCTEGIVQWTIMVKLEDGSSPSTNDWTWQNIAFDRTVQTQNDMRCISCHAGCGVPPNGYLGTCSSPTP
jgi:Cytochrome P460